MMTMKDIQQLFPSADGNPLQRKSLIDYMSDVITRIDQLKDPGKLSLGDMQDYSEDYYNQVIQEAAVPEQGLSMEGMIDKLLELAEGHRYVNSSYVANAAPLPNIASILGNLVMVLLNGNNLWDVEGPAAAEAEVKVSSMLAKVVGYEPDQSTGYTTWGGQGAVFSSLRLAIARQFPETNNTGIPDNLYCFCSDLSHYSLFKSMEATGIGVNNMIRVKVNRDHSMDIEDLKQKMTQVIEKGGIPLYVLATMGTTDTFGIDDIQEIKKVTNEIEQSFSLNPIYIHADSAMGGMYTLFNEYNFEENPLDLSIEAIKILHRYREKFAAIRLADSMVYDFHKLGQTPYITSLFLIKNKEDLRFVDLDAAETPYVGNRGYGSYHTSYTLECSRMGSALSIYASLLVLGLEGYQRLLANYIQVNLVFRESLLKQFSNVAVTNEVSPITTFRFYPDEVLWERELNGELKAEEIHGINRFNDEFAELIGLERETVFFGNTKKQRLVPARDIEKTIPLYAHKFFSISPYTTVEEVDRYIKFLKVNMDMHHKVPAFV